MMCIRIAPRAGLSSRSLVAAYHRDHKAEDQTVTAPSAPVMAPGNSETLSN